MSLKKELHSIHSYSYASNEATHLGGGVRGLIDNYNSVLSKDLNTYWNTFFKVMSCILVIECYFIKKSNRSW